MSQNDRPRRSVLYMPASNERALDKARTLKADGVIFDLEDAVAPDAKEAARKQALEALGKGGYGKREILLRTNALASPWGFEDLVSAAKSGADGVLLPKVESGDMVRQAEAILVANGAPESQRIWCMMETPRGILAAAEIAQSSPRLGGLVMGTSDLAKDLRCAHTRERLPMLASLGLVVLAARANGLACIDGVHLDLNDDEGFAYSCRQGREMGFDGKTLIHPKTIDAANEAFSPSESEVAFSRKIIAEFEAAQKAGKGVVVIDGRLIEHLHVVNAKRVVALADAIQDMGD
jgi:citrate lyase subunit beta/citryl-CoA lyase